LGIIWFENKLNQELAIIEDHFEKFRISDALMATYKLIWDDFCSWYLEIAKPAYQQPIDVQTLEATVGFFERLMKMLHPFMPFISEEVWHLLRERKSGDDIMISQMPVFDTFDEELAKAFQKAESILSSVRAVRKEKNIPNKDVIQLLVQEGEDSGCKFYPVVAKLGNIEEIKLVSEKPEGCISFIVGAQEFYIPLIQEVNVEEEIAKLEEELKYTNGFLRSVVAKLSNERFVNNAPEVVVEKERQKQSDAEARKSVIEEQLMELKKLI
jgi:valyl-tRNA synthetase